MIAECFVFTRQSRGEMAKDNESIFQFHVQFAVRSVPTATAAAINNLIYLVPAQKCLANARCVI